MALDSRRTPLLEFFVDRRAQARPVRESSAHRQRRETDPRGKPCHYCGAPATTRDHVVPVSHGGTDRLRNIVPACRPCNERRGNGPSGCDCAYCSEAWNHHWRRSGTVPA